MWWSTLPRRVAAFWPLGRHRSVAREQSPTVYSRGFCPRLLRTIGYGIVTYKCSEVYRPECEVGVAWNDPRIDVRWPLSSPIVSPKDAALRQLDELTAGCLPHYTPFADHELAPLSRGTLPEGADLSLKIGALDS